MRTGDPRLARIVSIAARVLTAAVVVLPPSIYFSGSYQHAAGVLEAEAEINARIVTRIVGANPDLWRYEQLRISEYLARRPAGGDAERRRVLDEGGAVVAESVDPLPRPWVTRSVPLYDAGVRVGTLEISRSLAPLLLRSGILGVVLLAAGALSYRAVRTLPLRAIERSHEALRRERDAAQRYLDAAGVAFVIVDGAGRVTLVNRKGCEILARAEEAVLGRDWISTFVEPADRPRVAAATSAAVRDAVPALQYSVLRPGGERRLVSWYLTPLCDEGAPRCGVLASGVDVTHESELEEQLRTAQKLEAIGRLAAGVAHDFNNVLSVIKGKASLLRRRVEEDDPRRRYVDDILASTDRGALLTANLLAFGRARDVRKEPVDLVQVVQRFEQSLRCLVREGVDLRAALPPEPLPVLAEPPEIERVLMNLVTNAQDAMPAGGRILISAARTTLDDPGAAARAGVDAPGPYAELSVADSGTGIEADARSNLFEPFFTTKAPGKGSGLGLSIAYAIMKQHHGAIRVASEPGRGATFTLLLPLLASLPAPPPAEGTAAPLA